MWDAIMGQRGDLVSRDSMATRNNKAFRRCESGLEEMQRLAQIGSWEWWPATDEVAWSNELYRIFGLDPASPPPRYNELANILTADSFRRLSAAVERALRTGLAFSLDLEMVRRDGAMRWIAARGEGVRDASGRIAALRGTMQDITERKQAEDKARSAQAALAEAERVAHLGSWELDVGSNELLCSEEFFRIFGLPLQDKPIPLARMMEAIAAEDRPRVQTALDQSLRTGRAVDFECRILRPDGAHRDIRCRGEVISEGGRFVRAVGAALDVTESKQAEEDLRKYREHIEELVASRTADLKAAIARLQAANKELEAFSYSVSHDLRAPLRAIDGFSLILLEDYAEKLDMTGRRLLNVVRDNAKKMGQLIDSILAFSRIGREEMRSAPVDMGELVQAALAALQPVSAVRTLKLKIKPLPKSRGDANMLQRVWTNLLDNAIKFTRSKPEAVIEVGATAEEAETIYYVKDNGVGFDMRNADRLFGLFQRLHDPEQFPGTGVGLAIVQRIVARHGGRVWAKGKPNEGATFYFALPAVEEEHGQTA